MILAAIVIAIDTGLRHEELLRLPWTDVDLDRHEVFIPADRAKSHRERTVPLLPRSLRILGKLQRWVRDRLGDDGTRRTNAEGSEPAASACRTRSTCEPWARAGPRSQPPWA